ncbi:DNA polymerase III subunit gamma/tau [Halorhodospira halophila]|uniref:DNA polymerase III subunit gamma/tau n=1 Tax=Halorhodospira halophila (strain DSM 244 / SL1) TaxID=349124 RepID=A1WTL4_HALHL|nr:DNA polymerase III subunit gamma/tau [Halorhodospira halophila]ABM61026.1 DNA polymerase III, subunits gamma and tau [Halorhodospira halophila SL1]MBK1729965.1 DNA polymerase III subunit gamma/tau [Halorhodospira halophila]
MTYQALARKWRPRRFEDVAGQEHVLRALANALADGRLHHAYLFSGTRGVGKTTVARILAKCLNCEHGITAEPCGTCDSCRELDAGRFVDLIEVDAASRTKVEDTRELLDNVQYAPTRGRFKIYLIDEVHMLSSHSFNALLKTLEEPPDHVKFLLATTDPQKLPVTVLSRCLQFHLRRLSSTLIRDRLLALAEEEGVTVDAGAAARLARAADGSLRDALSLLDQALAFGEGAARDDEVAAMLGAIERRHVLEVLTALADGDGAALVTAARHMAEVAADFDEALAELVATVHSLALAQQVPSAIGDDEPERDRLLALAERIDAEDLQLYYQIGVNARRDLPYAPDPATGFEMALLRMHAFRPAEGAPRVAAPTDGGRSGTDGGAPVAGGGGAQAGGGPAANASAGVAPPEPAAPPPGEAVGAEGATDEDAVARWTQIVGGLSGPLRMIAAHCEWVGREGARVILRLDESHEYLNNAERRERLQTALGEAFGETITLQIDIGPTRWTPAMAERQQAQERQAEAEQALAGDPALQGLCEAFDGQLHGVRPADGEGNHP